MVNKVEEGQKVVILTEATGEDELEGKITFIAGISLLVGGIGVMNIMLVSITEKTREIGTRKALGATNGSIRLQFIIESMTLCLIRGILGIITGLIMSRAVCIPGDYL